MFGGGGGGGGYFPPDIPERFDCSNVSIYTSLNSPNPSVISKLKIGDILDIYFDKKQSLLLVKKGGSIVGSITHLNLIKLIDCINQGHNFIATVLKITGGNCEILISNE